MVVDVGGGVNRFFRGVNWLLRGVNRLFTCMVVDVVFTPGQAMLAEVPAVVGRGKEVPERIK